MHNANGAVPPPHPGGDDEARRLAKEYAPILMLDRLEPFRPVVVGYDVFTEREASRSFPRWIEAGTGDGADPETRQRSSVVIEYAFWWDWDIQHLYELEHVWVWVDDAGDVTKVEASWHGAWHDMGLGEENGVQLRDRRPVLFVKPGKHAFAPSPRGFEAVKAEIVRACGPRAGTHGVWVTPLFQGKMPAKTPLADRLVHTYLERKQFVPSFEFDVEDEGESWKFLPWKTLQAWIPMRVSYLVEQLTRKYDPHERRWLRIAHRGASDYYVENGATALRKAAELGADMVEVDVRLSADGAAIVFHDEGLERMTTGAGRVAEHTLAELRKLRLKDERTGQLTDDGLLTLEEVIALCREEGIGLYVDVKDAAAVTGIADALAAANWQKHAIIGSDDIDVLRRYRRLDPHTATSWLIGWPAPPVNVLLETMAEADVLYFHPCWEKVGERPDRLLSSGDVAALQASGRGIISWHEERADVISGLRALGVDGVCSNRPEMLV